MPFACCVSYQRLQHDCHAAYFSPSIAYCSHPRYARVYVADRGGKRTYWQVVVETRVDESRVDSGKSDETMVVGATTVIDPNYPGNKHIEFLVKAGPAMVRAGHRYVRPEDGVVVTGLMVRVLEEDPMDLPENAWWAAWAEVLKIDLREAGKYYIYRDGPGEAAGAAIGVSAAASASGAVQARV